MITSLQHILILFVLIHVSFLNELTLADTNCSQYPVKIVHANLMMNDWISVPSYRDCACGIQCHWTEFSESNHINFSQFEVVVVLHHRHFYNKHDLNKSYPGQIMAFMEMEPPLPGTTCNLATISRDRTVNAGHTSYGIDPREAKKVITFKESGDRYEAFDWKMTYERDSDVQVTYANEQYAPNFDKYGITYANKSNEYFALLVVSNCQEEANYRLEYAKALMKNGINVMSLGRCMKNNDSKVLFAECHHGDDQEHGNKKCIVSKFKFYLSFENSRFHDYVTEKLFDIYDSGTIPVYMGAPNVKEVVPGAHSTIFVDDYKSPKELADYLKIVGNNEKLYNDYFEWKNYPLNPTFIQWQRNSWSNMFCNVCEKYSRRAYNLAVQI